jgi:hypothetical protein
VQTDSRDQEGHDKLLHQSTRVARVIEFERRPVDLLPPLFDATLIWMSNDQMALTGFERVDTTGDYTDHAQIWLCEEIGQGSQ